MKRKTLIPRKLPTHIEPTQAEREYFRHLRKYAEKYNSLMEFALREALPHLREVAANELPDPHKLEKDSSNFYKLDAVSSRFDTNIEKRVKELFDWVDRELTASLSDSVLQAWAKSMINNTSVISKKNISRVTEAVGIEVEPLLHDRDLNPFYQNVIDENVGLIKSIPRDRQVAFKNALVYGITSDMPRDQLNKLILKHIGSKGNVMNRARLIATDQVGKLNADLNQYRQQQLGGKRYRWKNAGDTRVAGNPSGKYPNAKPSHWHRQDKIYYWSKPPEGGHPGKRVRCRCRAEMVIEDILD